MKVTVENLPLVTIETAWGDIIENVKYDSYTGVYYHKTLLGDWINIEPHCIKQVISRESD